MLLSAPISLICNLDASSVMTATGRFLKISTFFKTFNILSAEIFCAAIRNEIHKVVNVLELILILDYEFKKGAIRDQGSSIKFTQRETSTKSHLSYIRTYDGCNACCSKNWRSGKY